MLRLHGLALLATCAANAASPAPSSQPSPQPFESNHWNKDSVALRQEVDTFSSLLDGHPAAPGDWELQLESGWLTSRQQSDSVPLAPTVKYTPHRYTESGYEFFEAMQLSLSMPLEMHEGNVEGSGDMTFGWQERWVAEHDGVPTIATLAEVRMPTGHDSSGADGTFTAILDKDFGPGTAYLNGWVRTANGDNAVQRGTGILPASYVGRASSPPMADWKPVAERRHFQWGLRSGYKWCLSERVAVIADYVHQASEETGHANINLLELSLSLRTRHHLSFGPGLLIGLDDHEETPRFGAGLRFIYLFNARIPPSS